MATLTSIDEYKADNAKLSERASDLSAQVGNLGRELKKAQQFETERDEAVEALAVAEAKVKTLETDVKVLKDRNKSLTDEIGVNANYLAAARKIAEGLRDLG